jgi:hypothetical protein
MMRLWTLICSLPELLKLIDLIEQAAEEAETERRVQDDIKQIHRAFIDKDPSQLNALFSGVPKQENPQ